MPIPPAPKIEIVRQVYIRQPATSALDAATITQLFDRLKSDKYGWQIALPVEFGTFFSSQVTVDFQTRPVPARGRPPRVSDVEKELARNILLHLDKVLSEVERQFESYQKKNDPESLFQITRPHIWINREEAEEVGSSCHWTFVVENADTDYGCHMEFDGLEFREIWSGD